MKKSNIVAIGANLNKPLAECWRSDIIELVPLPMEGYNKENIVIIDKLDRYSADFAEKMLSTVGDKVEFVGLELKFAVNVEKMRITAVELEFLTCCETYNEKYWHTSGNSITLYKKEYTEDDWWYRTPIDDRWDSATGTYIVLDKDGNYDTKIEEG